MKQAINAYEQLKDAFDYTLRSWLRLDLTRKGRDESREIIGAACFLFDNLYSHGDAKWEEPKAYAMLEELFDHFVSHVDEVPSEYRLHDDAPDVQVADFVSGMTDRYAVRLYEDLKIPKSWRAR